jgi:hypothetical protein
LKRFVSDVCVSQLSPIAAAILRHHADTSAVDEVLRSGAAQANEIADANYHQLADAVGLLQLDSRSR